MNPPFADPNPTPAKPPAILWIRRLTWVFIYLWIFEGVLRKWIFPSISAPLLVVRDPVAILIILLAIRENLRVPRAFLVAYVGLAFLLCILGFLQLVAGTDVRLSVVLFGLRTDLLDVPLIFIIGSVLDHEDVRSIGRHLLWMGLPMGLLMAIQFRAPIDSVINTSAGGQGLQIDSAFGHIRAPGTFSFINGVVDFFALVLAFILDNGLRRQRTNPILTQVATVGLLLGAVVSGSRTLLLSFACVGLALVFGVMLKFRSIAGLYKTLIWCGVAAAGISTATIWRDGIDTMVARMTVAETFSNGGDQTIGRIMNTCFGWVTEMWNVGILGHGLGLGTMVGSRLQTGVGGIYLLAEDELARIILECGPVAGLAFILFRVWITVFLFRAAVRATRQGNMLPILLLGTTVIVVVMGQWGQASEQGFAAISAGLCMAATRPRLDAPAPPGFGPGLDVRTGEDGPPEAEAPSGPPSEG